MHDDIYQKVKERMIRYAKVNTQSQPYSGTWPTTSCQFDLARMLRDELVEIGVSDVFLDEKSCVVYGCIHSDIGNKSGNKIGFIAHMDTAPNASGEHVIKHQYSNMKEILKDHPSLVDNLRKAIEDCGVTPVCEPFRGGTDGAALSFRGLPCPNLSAGYENAHGRFEYVPIQSMVKNVEILLRLCSLLA